MSGIYIPGWLLSVTLFVKKGYLYLFLVFMFRNHAHLNDAQLSCILKQAILEHYLFIHLLALLPSICSKP
jgi:hypothetical protein